GRSDGDLERRSNEGPRRCPQALAKSLPGINSAFAMPTPHYSPGSITPIFSEDPEQKISRKADFALSPPLASSARDAKTRTWIGEQRNFTARSQRPQRQNSYPFESFAIFCETVSRFLCL